MGLPRSAASEIVVVGDDAALETRMANAAGAVSVGVATGLNSLDYWRALPDRDRPLLAVEKAADLGDMLG
jgi:ribonucleotide monophosphatase NagD (HAD superfamily)